MSQIPGIGAGSNIPQSFGNDPAATAKTVQQHVKGLAQSIQLLVQDPSHLQEDTMVQIATAVLALQKTIKGG